jgi:hypothetical protein
MTFKILTDDTKKVIFRSNARSALDPKAKNLRLDPLGGETSTPIIRTHPSWKGSSYNIMNEWENGEISR